MKIGISIPDPLIEFADAEAGRRGLSRSALIADLIEMERVRRQMSAYLDRHGWDVAEDEVAWREYQRTRAAQEYADDDW
ncbi:MAG: hypothetical protein ABI609_07990 [Acidobacteriota bacterium]